MIKKIITRTLLAIVGLVVIGCLVCLAQISKSKHVNIPTDATSVVRIDNYQIIKAVFPDWLSQSGKTAKSPKEEKPKIGLSIPFNIFAYSEPSTGYNVFYARFKIRNKKDFDNYLSEKFSAETSGNLNIFCSKDKHVFICKDDENAAIAFSLLNVDNANLVQNLQMCLTQKSFVSLSESPFKDILNQENIATIQTLNGNANLNYQNHEILLNGLFKNEFFKIKSFQSANVQNPILALNIHGLVLPKTHIGEFNWNGKSVSIDSLLKYTQGNAALYWVGNLNQNVENISYETDENFNQIAVKKSVAKTVPNILLLLGNENHQASQYFQHLQFIDPVSELDHPIANTIFPLFNLQSNVTDSLLTISTVGASSIALNNSVPEPLSLAANFKNKDLTQIFPKEYSKYWQDFQQFQIHTEITDKGNQISINGKLSFADPKLGILQVAKHIF